MNKKILLIFIVLSIILSITLYKKYKSNTSYNKYYILQVGAYKDINNISKVTKNYNNYIVYKEDNLYKIFIGVTKDIDIYNRLVDTYSDKTSSFKKEIIINDTNFNKKISEYDNLINKIDKTSDLDIIIKSELKELKLILD